MIGLELLCDPILPHTPKYVRKDTKHIKMFYIKVEQDQWTALSYFLCGKLIEPATLWGLPICGWLWLNHLTDKPGPYLLHPQDFPGQTTIGHILTWKHRYIAPNANCLTYQYVVNCWSKICTNILFRLMAAQCKLGVNCMWKDQRALLHVLDLSLSHNKIE